MEMLTKHVSIKEVSKSDTAIRLGIDNTPTGKHLENIKLLCEKVFEPVREWAKVPIKLSSVYRSEKLNKAVKGSSTSQHCANDGAAMDIDNDGSTVTNKMIFDYVKANIDFDQMIWEFGNESNPDWVHISYKAKGNRKQILKAVKQNGKTAYIPYK
jgi:zinc D-Ala-D-Ala carboxypeptidase